MRIAPLLALCCSCPLWAVEPTDLRLNVELWSSDYSLDIIDPSGSFSSSEDLEFDNAFSVRVSMTQPLGLLETGDLISVLSIGYLDATDDDVGSLELRYQGVAGRYGFGYRADLGTAFSLDVYPFLGAGWNSFEVGDSSDPSYVIDLGAQADLTLTFGDWQLGGLVGWNWRQSSHSTENLEWELSYQALTYGLSAGYRF
mgnify:CR=1 FL=1